MAELATKITASIDNQHLSVFANRLSGWLIADLNQSDEKVPDFTESRAKAIMRAMGVSDDPTRHSFARLMEQETAVRIALHDLLTDSGLADDEEIEALAIAAAAISEPQPPISWPPLVIAAYAWKSGYPLYQLDPASPPGEYSPAGQVIKRAAHFMRRQIQRSATERDKLGRKLAYAGNALPGAPTLDNLQGGHPAAAAPPHYRSPIPVRYPEVESGRLRVDPDQPLGSLTAVPRTELITVEVEPAAPSPPPPSVNVTTMPSIQITAADIPTAPPSRATAVGDSVGASISNFSGAVRRQLQKEQTPTGMTRLRIVVEEHPDGPGLYGLQVKVTCKGIKSAIAGITNRDGQLLCELPVRQTTGLTYDVDITWPRDMGGGETERKSITLHADRAEFTLPFYLKHSK